MEQNSCSCYSIKKDQESGSRSFLILYYAIRKNFIFITTLSKVAISTCKRINYSFTGSRSFSVAGAERLLLLSKNMYLFNIFLILFYKGYNICIKSYVLKRNQLFENPSTPRVLFWYVYQK